MSLTLDGRRIYCDGRGCPSSVEAPVSLRRVLMTGDLAARGTLRGWLFMSNEGVWTHLCPHCVHRFGGHEAAIAVERENVGT